MSGFLTNYWLSLGLYKLQVNCPKHQQKSHKLKTLAVIYLTL